MGGYFRLKIKDLDGIYEYSEMIHIHSSCKIPIYSLSSNPTKTGIEVSGLTNGDWLLLSDITGRTITKFNFHQTNEFDLQHLAASIYVVQVIKKGGILANFKIVKL